MSQGRGRNKAWMFAAALLLVAGGAAAQETPQPSQGIDAGNYNIQNSIEMGWRYSNFTGNEANYDSFVNLHSGPRLLNFSLGMRSLNHNGSLFDNFSLTGFGFGGDPNDVARLNISKNKWYSFDATFRRDKYFFGYNQLANTFNPAASLTPITFAPHLLDYARGMSDFDLTLFPQSALRFRLGYSHINEQGPSFSSLGAGPVPEVEPSPASVLFETYRTSTELYRAGVDFNFLSKTTLSYDQIVQHFKQDPSQTDGLLTVGLPGLSRFVLSNGVPADLGIFFTTPPPPATCGPSGTCNAYLSYTRGGRPRLTLPTERFSFQTRYVPKLTMAGQFSYSSGTETVGDLREYYLGNDTRVNGQGTATAASSQAKRVLINGDWTAVYEITRKFRVTDTFNYNSYRLPGDYLFDNGNLFQTIGNGASLLALTPGQPITLDPTTLGTNFAATCPAPYTAVACPNHSAGSGPDLAIGARLRYLGQEIRANTFQFEYSFTPRWGAHLGYRYSNRKIHDFDALFYNEEIFLPGGPGGAARGDCAPIPPSTTSPCPAGTGNFTGGFIFSGLTPSSDTQHNLMADINGHSALLGFWGRPRNNFRTSVDVELFSADRSFTRITPRQLQHFRLRATYLPVHWVQLDGVANIIQNRDNVVEVRDKEYNHNYSFSGVFSPNDRLSVDLGYNYNIIRTQALVCYTLGFGPLPAGNTPCPLAGSPVPVGSLSIYRSTSHFANADVMVKPVKKVRFWVGYAGNFVRGTPSFQNLNGLFVSNFLYPQTPWGPLRFGYQRPYVNMDFAITNHISYQAGWTYYGYNQHSPADPATLAPIGTENFNGNLATFSVRYTL